MHCSTTRNFGGVSSAKVVLSVVVPVGPMVGQLDNLLTWIEIIQRFPAQVILVVDEKSDGTYSELIELLERREIMRPLSVIHAICNGPGNARNLGVDEAIGTWIAFWDSDDKPNVQETFNAIQQSDENVDALVCRYQAIGSTGAISNPLLTRLQIAMNPGLWRFIFKRDRFTKFHFANLRLAEDQLFLMQSGVFSKNLKLHDTVNYQYIHGGPNQLTKNNRNLRDILDAVIQMLSLEFDQDASQELQYEMRNLMVSRLLLTSLKKNAISTLFFMIKNAATALILIKSAPLILIAKNEK